MVGTIAVEAAHVMQPDEGPDPAAFAEFRLCLPHVELQHLSRTQFCSAARGPDLALAIACGDRRHYANILLTVGALPELTNPPVT